ncbi:MAG TPA: acyl-CoA dehydrogenase family protein [Candidatus Thermoplasmatota archaeon]|nr:acyl-CoA dehydrogenase family protein [Candidatus Thermoplasmatota archaeon]
MVDFTIPDDARMIREAVGAFIEKEVRVEEQKLGRLVQDERLALDDAGFLRQEIVDSIARIRRKSAAAGYYAMHMPAEVGGGGVSKVATYLAWKEVMQHGIGLNMAALSFVEGPTPLFLKMSAAQQKAWLAPMMRGERTSAFCLTEPGAGSDVAAIETRAVRQGDEYVLNGTKSYITNGPYADHLQVFAKTDPSAGLYGISCFMVPTDAPGVERGAVQQSILNDGGQCEYHLRDVRVPIDARVGDEGEGFSLAIGNIGDTRVTIGGQAVGLAERLLHQMVEYAQQRAAFGRPIGKQGQLQSYIADSATEIYAADNMVLNTCWRIDNGMDVVKESSMVKLYCTEMAFRVADRAVQVHGGSGLMKEVGLEKAFRFARLLRIPEGTSEIQRWTIAKTLGL